MTATIDDIELGDIQSERQVKFSSLFQQNRPRRNSQYAILLDIFGMGRTITIDGIITGTDSTHVTFIDKIESLADGLQEGVTFVSSKTGVSNKTVFIDSFDWRVNKADVSKISYTLSLKEGGSITS